jgi:predicted SpoU family rRNA methylase
VKANRKIELSVMPQEEQLAIMVRNTFDGRVVTDKDQFISTKKDGGIGLQSVRAVVRHYGESFFTEYNQEWFSAFVLWKRAKNGA